MIYVLHHFLFCQKQAFCCSFAFSSSLWINSTSINNAVRRRRYITTTAQSWEHPLWNLFTTLWLHQILETIWLWMVPKVSSLSGFGFMFNFKQFWCFFVLEYWNLILFLSKFPLSFWGQKLECSFHSVLKNNTQICNNKAWQLEAVFDCCDLYSVIHTRF